ncbi:MAG: Hsp20/alpha crystallin family protein [Gammaproteobacteria bacterium]|nr:Hsp20/alpha crystallin family protein [Gammaproteobacteria bacterium]
MTKIAKKDEKATEAGKEIQMAQPAHSLRRLDDIESMYDRWFENFFPRGWLQPLHRDWPFQSERKASTQMRLPKVDVIDRDDMVVVRAEIPGVEKENLEVVVSDNMLTIKGEKKQETKEEKGDYYRCELSQGGFSRTLMLPHYVNTEGSKAKFKDGVLELTMPKIDKALRRSIKID